MKYVCFGYLDLERWSNLSPAEQTAMMDACFAYDEEVLKQGSVAIPAVYSGSL